MQNILIFSGTSEGRELAGRLADNGVSVTVCVATEYGKEVMAQEEKRPGIQVKTGRLDEEQMQLFLADNDWDFVVDATHPFAREVSENIAKVCEKQGREFLRLLREEEQKTYSKAKITYADSAAQAASYLNQASGNVFLTTGSKELAVYVEGIQDISRLYARILPNAAEVEHCRRLGLKGNQIIGMQGPFGAELNLAMIREIKASILVTKETSRAGGFDEKLRAAEAAGIETVVIRRPKETGYSMAEILARLGIEEKKSQVQRKIILAGTGMGSLSNFTREVYQACQDADILIGAARMLEPVKFMGKPMINLYRSKEIADYIAVHTEYQNMVVLLSGDVGFYSGAKKLREEIRKRTQTTAADAEKIENVQIFQLCGVPSPAYFAGKLGIAWEDFALMSLHGRQQNFIGTLQSQGKVFALTEGAEGIRRLSRELIAYGLSQVQMYVGFLLSAPQEEILRGKPKDFLNYDKEGPSVVILLYEKEADYVLTPGIPDGEFVRGQAPMTKEEVRSVSLSKLALTRESVVYDIGAGTGSVAVECARLCLAGNVYAIEKKEQALELLEQNKRKHKVWNLEIIPGEAPEAFADLPAPTHAFLGGSGGRFLEIVKKLQEKNPGVRLVLNVISLETLGEVIEWMKSMSFSKKEIVQISVAKAKELGSHPMMMGQNPVYVITLQK